MTHLSLSDASKDIVPLVVGSKHRAVQGLRRHRGLVLEGVQLLVQLLHLHNARVDLALEQLVKQHGVDSCVSVPDYSSLDYFSVLCLAIALQNILIYLQR